MKTRAVEAAAPIFIVLWSSAFIAGIIGVSAAPPMMLLFARFVLGGLALTLYAVAMRATWPHGAELRHAIVAGLLMQVVQFGAFYTAMSHHVTGAVIAVVQGLNPVVIALFAGRVLGETVTRRQWLGFAVGGIGVAMAVADQASFSVIGLVLCIVGLLGLSVGTVYQKRFTPTIDPRAATAVHTLASAPVAGVLAVLGGNLHVWHVGSFAAALTWMVLVNSMAAFLLLNAMLRRWDTTRVGKLFFATPAVTAVMAWLLIGQPLRPLTVAGLAVGVLGLALAARRADQPMLRRVSRRAPVAA